MAPSLWHVKVVSLPSGGRRGRWEREGGKASGTLTRMEISRLLVAAVTHLLSTYSVPDTVLVAKLV